MIKWCEKCGLGFFDRWGIEVCPSCLKKEKERAKFILDKLKDWGA